MPKKRDWFISEALTSVRRLVELLPQLTDAEIAHVIEVEEGAQRRDTVLTKLYREARQRARKQFIR